MILEVGQVESSSFITKTLWARKWEASGNPYFYVRRPSGARLPTQAQPQPRGLRFPKTTGHKMSSENWPLRRSESLKSASVDQGVFFTIPQPWAHHFLCIFTCGGALALVLAMVFTMILEVGHAGQLVSWTVGSRDTW